MKNSEAAPHKPAAEEELSGTSSHKNDASEQRTLDKADAGQGGIAAREGARAEEAITSPDAADAERSEPFLLNGTATNAFSADSEAPRSDLVRGDEFAAELADGTVRETGWSRGGNAENRGGGTNGAGADALDDEAEQGRGWGILALTLAIASWFIWPAVLAPASVIAGIAAFVQGRRRIGSWSIALGLIAFFLYLAATPLI